MQYHNIESNLFWIFDALLYISITPLYSFNLFLHSLSDLSYWLKLLQLLRFVCSKHIFGPLQRGWTYDLAFACVSVFPA